MKYLTLFLLVAVAACKSGNENTKRATAIDKLTTNAQVEAYVRTTSRYKSFTLNDFTAARGPEGTLDVAVKKIVAENNITQSYIKEDFDNNGYTDLLVNGLDSQFFYQCLLLMSYGPDKVEVIDLLGHDSANPIIIHAVTLGGKPCIRMHRPYPARPKGKEVADSINNLCYKSGGFVEYNQNPATHKIEKIQFGTSGCFGKCPIFQIAIHQDLSASFLAERFNFSNDYEEENRFFSAKLNQADYDKITALLNYIDFESLKDTYSVGWTDDEEARLIITYDGGKTKTINDYGMVGTYGLKNLYRLFKDLRFNQKWQKAAQPDNFKIEVLPEPPPPPKQ